MDSKLTDRILQVRHVVNIPVLQKTLSTIAALVPADGPRVLPQLLQVLAEASRRFALRSHRSVVSQLVTVMVNKKATSPGYCISEGQIRRHESEMATLPLLVF